ncbi:hypothetical protein VTJ49DRAFT_6723 [Mycothermus thermophilus]|uniref:Uncharacterized protein n=1 Tax=Humicola insolens TaxID=85995 RepID=A0ABR3VIR5_HUMIN
MDSHAYSDNTRFHQEYTSRHVLDECPPRSRTPSTTPPWRTSSNGSVPTNTPSRYRWISWWSLAWRLVLSLLFSLLLLVVLYSYSGQDKLSTWDRRLFNTLTILFSSLASLSLGSLLGLLGAALRWPLLARRAHSPREVDLILGMQHPSVSLKLITYHCGRGRNMSVTTLVVLVYLIFNMAVRLSVAVFGLTYNLDENVYIDYPVMVTDFGSDEWLRYNLSYNPFTLENAMSGDVGSLTDFGLRGLLAVPTLFDKTDPSTYNMNNISGYGLDRSAQGGNVDGSTVTYTYHVREYQGLDEYSSSDKVIRSSSTCLGRTLWQESVYERGKKVATLETMNSESGQEFLALDSPEYLHVFLALNRNMAGRNYVWAMDWNGTLRETPGPPCLTTYMYEDSSFITIASARFGTLYECRTCITDRHGEPGISGDIFFNYNASLVPYATGLLLMFGAIGSNSRVSYGLGELETKKYDAEDQTMHFLNGLTTQLSTSRTEYAVPIEQELTAAHLAAQLPILAMIGAQEMLPRVVRDEGASEQAVIVTTLQVKWPRAIAVLAGVLAVQLLVVAVVWSLSRRVPVVDHDSVFVAARLLRTAMSTVEGGSLASGRDLAEGIGKVAGKMRYGTRRIYGGNEEVYEADLWEDVEDVFPKKAHYA